MDSPSAAHRDVDTEKFAVDASERSTAEPSVSAGRSKRRIVFVNRCYWPDQEATGQLLTDLAEGLSVEFDVHVLCGQPNSPSTKDFRKLGVERHNGVTVHRVGHTRFAKRMPAGRIGNLLSFAWAARRYLRRQRLEADVFVAETDPFLLPAVVVPYATANHVRSVCYLQDIYPDVAEATGHARPGRFTQWIRRRLRSGYRAADRVVVLGECMKRRLTESPWELDPNDLTVIPNWADTEAIRPQPHHDSRFRKALRLSDRTVLMHSGNMGLTQNLDAVVQATGCSEWPANASLVLVGDGAARQGLETATASLPPGRVEMHPYQPRSELADSLAAANIHLVSLDAAVTGCICPSKFYGILAAGRPVLFIGDPRADVAVAIEEHRLGWVCHRHEPEDIARTVRSAVDDVAEHAAMGQRGRELAETLYNPKVIQNRFADLFRSLVETRSMPPNS